MVPRSPEALVGQTLGGRFRVLYMIASGGMGTVYEARDEVLSRRVAIKVIRGDHLVDTALRARFKREALATAAVSHPALVALHDLSLDTDPPFFVMELVDGAPLEELLAREGRIAWTRAASLAADALEGLEALHAAGVVHRDIKPSNLMIVGSGSAERCRLIDLGVARLITAPMDDARTATGVAVGTPAYMAPEQLAGERVGPTADLWAMGVVLYKCLVGFHPFSANRGASAPKRAHEIITDVPVELGELVGSLLAHAPQERPPSAGLVARRLRTILQRAGAQHAAFATPVPPAAANLSTPGASHAALPITPHTQSTVDAREPIAAARRTKLATPVAVGVAIGAALALSGGVALQAFARRQSSVPNAGTIGVVPIDERVPLVTREIGAPPDASVTIVAQSPVERPTNSTGNGTGNVVGATNTVRNRARNGAVEAADAAALQAVATQAPTVVDEPLPSGRVETPTVTANATEPAPHVAPAAGWSGSPAIVLPSSPGNRPGNRLSVQYSSLAGRGVRDLVEPLVTPRLERCIDPRTHYAMRLLMSYRVRVSESGALDSVHTVSHAGTDVERDCVDRAFRAIRWPTTGASYDVSVRATVQL